MLCQFSPIYLWPLIAVGICFRSIAWEQIDGIWPNFAYALMLTRSSLGLLHVNFRKFTTELWPLTCQNFVSAQYLDDKSMEFDLRYSVLRLAMIPSWHFFSAQYFENGLMEFDQMPQISRITFVKVRIETFWWREKTRTYLWHYFFVPKPMSSNRVILRD